MIAWDRFARGGAFMGAALVACYVAQPTLGGVPYPPAQLAALFIRAAPGDFATAMIERLGPWAIRALFLSVHAAALVLGAFMGAVVEAAATPTRRARRAWGAGAGLFLAASLLSLAGPESPSLFAVGVYALCASIFARLAAGVPLIEALAPELAPGEAPLDGLRRSRRQFVARAVAVIASLGLAAGGAVRFLRGQAPIEVDIVSADQPFIPPPDDLSFPKLRSLSPEITPTSEFYTVDINLVKPRVDHVTWRLKIGGLTQRPYELTYRQLQDDFEVVEMAHTLSCISNEVGGDLVSTAVWRGVRLKGVLERAGMAPGVVDIVLRSAEGYSDSIPLPKALEDTTLVVFGMNGRALPVSHGFPARIIVPGIYGMKNVKWLTAIEPTDHDYRGYWMVRGWSDEARVKTQSRIDVPAGAVSTPAIAGGVAWAGDRGILAVEVSEDDGRTWRPAVLKRELSSVAWRLWAAELPPRRGSRRVLAVRAVDGTGEVQTARRARPHPDGASGYHRVHFEVK